MTTAERLEARITNDPRTRDTVNIIKAHRAKSQRRVMSAHSDRLEIARGYAISLMTATSTITNSEDNEFTVRF